MSTRNISIVIAFMVLLAALIEVSFVGCSNNGRMDISHDPVSNILDDAHQ
jgi:hypothetical protein